MKKKCEIIEGSQKFAGALPRHNSKKFRLKDVDPDDTGEVTSEDKPRGKRTAWKQGFEILAELQDVLYAQDQWSILLIFQAMDAAGKDGAIKHVMVRQSILRGASPFHSRAPSAEDLKHD